MEEWTFHVGRRTHTWVGDEWKSFIKGFMDELILGLDESVDIGFGD
jgi:hypothetical protein